MQPATDRERDIARIVDERSKAPDFRPALIGEIGAALRFELTPQEIEFMVAYIIWRVDHPIAAAPGSAPVHGQPKRNRRRRTRYASGGTLRFLWDDGSGNEHPAKGEIIDISVDGLRLRIDERIPLRAYILCNDRKLGIAGRGCVRNCNFIKGKYEVGLEFTGGTGWREPQLTSG